MSWTTPADVRARVRRRWDDGSLLRAYAAREPLGVIDLPVRAPRPTEIGERLEEVRAWIAELDAGSRGGSRYEVLQAAVGGRLVGRNQLPHRIVVGSYEQAWSLLGVATDVRRLDAVMAETESEPAVASWGAAHPLKAIDPALDWPALVSAYRWLDAHRGSGRYLRQIDAPGVDTKLVERHRSVLAAMLGVATSATSFLSDLGLAAKPELLRLRLHTTTALGGLTDVTARVEELRTLRLRVRTAVVVENEVTFLSLPVPDAGVLLWGKGFEVDRTGSLPWLRDAEIHYWGDLDTHGFAILDRMRAWLPQTRSFLMDEATLLHHRDRWGREPAPTRARLRHLTWDERALYEELVEDRHADRVRLEQERIDWEWVLERLPVTDDLAAFRAHGDDR